MADVKQYPPRQANFSIQLVYKDVAYLIRQGVSMPEVMSFFTEEELHDLIDIIHVETNARENKGA